MASERGREVDVAPADADATAARDADGVIVKRNEKRFAFVVEFNLAAELN